MKKILINIILTLAPIYSFSQTEIEINSLIDSLSWNSITCYHNYLGSQLNYADSNVKKLIQIGQPSAELLLNSIEESDKTVIIHIILTNILGPKYNSPFLGDIGIHKDCNNLIGGHLFYNGLIWEYFINTGYSIRKEEIDKVKEYWTKRLKGENVVWRNNDYEIYSELRVLDSITYPCPKIYENNSENLKTLKLIKLLNSKFPSEKFDLVFGILGNDSTISKYDDCFYISYNSDCISFRFNKDNYLTTIFFYPSYKADLINGIKITDMKADIIKKIGNPDKQREDWFWYEKDKIGIDFNKDNTIKHLQINKQ